MRRFFFPAIAIFFLFIFFSSQSAYAASVCNDGGQPQPGRGGAVGDRCIAGPGDECCRRPDGDATQTLICDSTPGSQTQNTCILASNTGQKGSVCTQDSNCDQNKNLKCINNKCAEVPCSHVDGVCGGNTSCCSNENLKCSTAPGGAAGTCTSVACKKSNETCSSNTDCCQGQNLTCDSKTKKCTSTCLGKGETCSSENPGQAGSCCSAQGLVCDINRFTNPAAAPSCVAKDALDTARKKGAVTPKPLPLPPSPPCVAYASGGCSSVATAFGDIKTDPAGFITTTFGVLFAMVGGIGLLLFMRAGYRMMTSQGKPEALQQGREEFVAVVIGLLFIVFSFVLLELIGVDILRIPGATPAGKTNPATAATCADLGGACSNGQACRGTGGVAQGQKDCAAGTLCCVR